MPSSSRSWGPYEWVFRVEGRRRVGLKLSGLGLRICGASGVLRVELHPKP